MPWTPDIGQDLAIHLVLRTLLQRYGRAMARLSTLDAAEIGVALRDIDTVANSAAPRSEVIHQAVRELDREFFLGDDTWRALHDHFSTRQILELCTLVGHYRTHTMIGNTLRTAAAR